MNMNHIKEILAEQKDYFEAGKTRSIKSRFQSLCALEEAVRTREYDILQALYEDLGKGSTEGYMSEAEAGF